MAKLFSFLSNKRCAVVTGANKGIGLEICRQLACQGVTVVLTSRDPNRGLKALHSLVQSGISYDSLLFHQLDLTDPTSFAPLAAFINSNFGKLDILVNNAGIIGALVNFDALQAAGFGTGGVARNHDEVMTQTYELAKECLQTNYYGVKNTTEALLPLLNQSDSPRIINVSSLLGQFRNIPDETIRGVLSDTEKLTEGGVDEILSAFLRDMKDGSFKDKGWYKTMAAYTMSKAAVGAYTRILAKKYTSILINCISPGFVKTDINGNIGYLSVEEGATSLVSLALVPQASPSGLFFERNQVFSFE